MGLEAIFRDAASAIKTAHPELTVTVTYAGASVTALRGTGTRAAAFADMGEMGNASSTIWVDASAFAEPAKGATITVGATACFVMSVRMDGAGAFWIIEYQEQKPK
jgi:hypothetical protein